MFIKKLFFNRSKNKETKIDTADKLDEHKKENVDEYCFEDEVYIDYYDEELFESNFETCRYSDYLFHDYHVEKMQRYSKYRNGEFRRSNDENKTTKRREKPLKKKK